MFVFNKKIITESTAIANQWKGLGDLRRQNEQITRNMLHGGQKFAANQAALIPTDAYRELDAITQRVFMNDEGQGYMNDLMGIAKGLDIGKTAYLYRQASDKSGIVTRSLSGQVPEALSKTEYDFDGDPVPIFTTGYGREWREERAFQSEGFDAMFDDHANSMRDIKEDMAIYMLTGDSSVNVRGYAGQGILNHRSTQQINLGAAGSNINLTTATSDEIIQFFTRDFAQTLDNNYTAYVDRLWVSPQIGRKLDEPYSPSGDFKEGTIRDYILRYGRIKDIQVTFELGRSIGPGQGEYNAAGEGNEFFAYVRNQEVICPLVGQAVSTVAVPRLMPMDNMNNLIWSAMGMRIRSDANNRSKVFYASATS